MTHRNSMAHPLSFTAWLKQCRTEHGLTQAQLAGRAGISLSLLRKYESGARIPPVATAARLADVLGLAGEERAAFLAAARRAPPRPPAAPAPLPAAPGWVPAAPTPLLGREPELARLVDLALTAPGRLVTLIGPPGVGKSRLALAAAAALRPRFAAGAVFIELAAVDSPADVAPLIAARLGLHAADVEAALIAFVAQRALLLALDNFEHLLDAAPLVARLLAAAPQIVVLATSRAPLHLRAEMRFPVAPLALPRTGRLPAVAAAPATRLFCERAAAVAPNFALTAANAEQVAALCRRLDGLPLAIELAAARSDQLAPAELLQSLDAGLGALDGGFADLPPHQRTLHATIAWSERRLPVPARDTFARLGVFRGSFDATAAMAVGAGQLDALVEAGMLQALEAGRFRMLETLRTYAAERLADSPADAAVHARYAAHYTAVAAAAAPLLDGAAASATMAQLDADLPNLRAVIGWSLTEDGGVAAARITAALRVYWLSRGAVREGRLVEALLTPDAAHAIPPAQLARALLTVGYLASQQGSLGAFDQIERGLALARQHGDPADIALGLILKGMISRSPGNLARCASILSEAISIARELDSPLMLAYALNQLGFTYNVHGHFREALPLLEEAVAVAWRAGEQVMVYRYRCDLAEALRAQGDLAQARQLLTGLLAELGADGDQTATWEALLWLALIDLEEGDLAAAARGLDAAEPIVKELGIGYGEVYLLLWRGYLALAQGDAAGARRRLTDAYAIAHRFYGIEEIAAILAGLAHLALDSARARAARLCGASEGLAERFALRENRQAERLRRMVRAALGADERELADAAAHLVIERIPQISFPTLELARDSLRLERVIAAALRG